MRDQSREQDVGRRIATSRHICGLSQGTVSRRSGIDPSYLSRIETGKVHPTVLTATRIAKAMSLSLDDLLGPSPPERRGKPCPVSASGRCLLDLASGGSVPRRGEASKACSTQQLRIVRLFTALLRHSSLNALKAIEVLFAEMTQAEADKPG